MQIPTDVKSAENLESFWIFFILRNLYILHLLPKYFYVVNPPQMIECHKVYLDFDIEFNEKSFQTSHVYFCFRIQDLLACIRHTLYFCPSYTQCSYVFSVDLVQELILAMSI